MLTRAESNIRNLFILNGRTFLRPSEFAESMTLLDKLIAEDYIEELGCGSERVYSLTDAGVERYRLQDYDLYNYEEPDEGLSIDTSGFGDFVANLAAPCRHDKNGVPLPPVIHAGVLWVNEGGEACQVCGGRPFQDYEYCLYCNRYGLIDNT